MAAPLGLAATIHAGALRRVGGQALSRRAELVSNEGRDGRLPRVVRAGVQASRAHGNAGHAALAARRWISRRDEGLDDRGETGRRRDVHVSAADDAGLRAADGSSRRAVAFVGVSQSGATRPGRRVGRRRGEFRRGDRDGGRARGPRGLALGTRRRRGAFPSRHASGRGTCSRHFSFGWSFTGCSRSTRRWAAAHDRRSRRWAID